MKDNIEVFTMDGGNSALPFIIGVSGHRDIISLSGFPDAGIEGVKNAVKSSLMAWKECLGEETPIWIMTGMAAGSDLLVVDVAEELIVSGWDPSFLKIIPTLPMPQEAFEQDFNDETELLKLRGYLDKYGEETFVIKSNLPKERYLTALSDTRYQQDRNSLYFNQGAFLARYSNVLLCLWDGFDCQGRGGTADVVKLKLGIEVPWPIEAEYRCSALAPPDSFERHFDGVVQHIEVERQKSLTPPYLVDQLLRVKPDEAFSILPCYIGGQLGEEQESIGQLVQSKSFYTLIDQLKGYNHEVAQPVEKLEDLETHPSLKDSGCIFGKSDAIAKKYQSAYRVRMGLFFISSLLGLCAYELVGNYLGLPLGISLSVLIFTAIFACWYLIKAAKKKQWKLKYQIARGIAEAIRIKGYLNQANLEPDNQSIMLRKYKNRFPIFEHAMSVVEIEWWKYSLERDYAKVENAWIQDQKNFLSTRIKEKDKKIPIKKMLFKRPAIIRNFLQRWAGRLFLLAAFLGGILLLIQLIPVLEVKHWAMNDPGNYLMVAIQYLLLASAVATLWNELANYHSTVSGYEELINLYDMALNVMATQNPAFINPMLKALAREALLEHCEWSQFESLSDIQARG